MSSQDSEQPKPYPVGPGEASPAASKESLQQAHSLKVERGDDAQPLALEPEAPPEKNTPRGEAESSAGQTESSVKALDTCPNCGASMAATDTLLCLRCGFDLKTLKVIKTVTGEAAKVEQDEQDEQEDEEAPPISAPGRGELWLPGAVAIASLLILSIGYLSAARGLFTDADAIGVGWRLMGLLNVAASTAVLTFAGLGGLFVVATILQRPLGDVKLAAARMLGIVAAIALLRFVNVEIAAWEWTFELASQAVAFIGLAMAMFRLSVRDAATVLGVTVLAVVGLLMVSKLVLWAVLPFG